MNIYEDLKLLGEGDFVKLHLSITKRPQFRISTRDGGDIPDTISSGFIKYPLNRGVSKDNKVSFSADIKQIEKTIIDEFLFGCKGYISLQLFRDFEQNNLYFVSASLTDDQANSYFRKSKIQKVLNS